MGQWVCIPCIICITKFLGSLFTRIHWVLSVKYDVGNMRDSQRYVLLKKKNNKKNKKNNKKKKKKKMRIRRRIRNSYSSTVYAASFLILHHLLCLEFFVDIVRIDGSECCCSSLYLYDCV